MTSTRSSARSSSTLRSATSGDPGTAYTTGSGAASRAAATSASTIPTYTSSKVAADS